MESVALYGWAKAIHVAAAVLFVGNIVVSGVWKLLADRSRDRSVIEFAQRSVILADWVLTGPAAAILLASGLTLVGRTGLDLHLVDPERDPAAGSVGGADHLAGVAAQVV